MSDTTEAPIAAAPAPADGPIQDSEPMKPSTGANKRKGKAKGKAKAKAKAKGKAKGKAKTVAKPEKGKTTIAIKKKITQGQGGEQDRIKERGCGIEANRKTRNIAEWCKAKARGVGT